VIGIPAGLLEEMQRVLRDEERARRRAEARARRRR
jgi:hypothetical protein